MVQDPDIALLAHRIGVKHWLEQDYYDCVYPDVMHSYGLSKKKDLWRQKGHSSENWIEMKCVFLEG